MTISNIFALDVKQQLLDAEIATKNTSAAKLLNALKKLSIQKSIKLSVTIATNCIANLANRNIKNKIYAKHFMLWKHKPPILNQNITHKNNNTNKQ